MNEEALDSAYKKLENLRESLTGCVDYIGLEPYESYIGSVIINRDFEDYDIGSYFETYGATWGGEWLYNDDEVNSILNDLEIDLKADLEILKKHFPDNRYKFEFHSVEVDYGFIGHIDIFLRSTV